MLLNFIFPKVETFINFDNFKFVTNIGNNKLNRAKS